MPIVILILVLKFSLISASMLLVFNGFLSLLPEIGDSLSKLYEIIIFITIRPKVYNIYNSNVIEHLIWISITVK